MSLPPHAAAPFDNQQQPPHIRLNSDNDDLLGMNQDSSSPPLHEAEASSQPTSRTLIPPQAGSASIRQQSSQNTLYNGDNNPAESAELLLPPRRSRTRRFRDDDDDPMRSPSASGYNSRRTSWSSESAGSRDSRLGPFASPFDDSRAPSRASSDDDGVNTQTVSEKYNILPSAGLLLFPEDVEKDDYLHNPDPNEKESRIVCSDLFSSRGIINLGGLVILTAGIAMLFIGLPILTFVSRDLAPKVDACTYDSNCLKDNVALLSNVRTGLVDPATPSSALTRTSAEGKTMNLVFSDEFEDEGRTFHDGDDPYFQGVDLWYGVTQDLEWYDPDAISTANGTLNIRFDAFQNHNLNYRSGMLQSWNKLCFKGGYLEASISLPGAGDTIGFWPGFWAMGNLGRPGYPATTDGTWPYSYHDVCDAGITANQSDPSGLNALPGMRLPACTCDGEAHPSPGKSRYVAEIDALEASVGYLTPPVGDAVGQASQSFQVAPFDMFYRPNTDFIEVYDQSISMMNSYQGGVYQQALSTLTNLNNDWYNGRAYQTYGFEYSPGSDGYVKWFVGDTATWKVTADAVGPNGNIGQRVMPEEPLSIIANFGLSSSFATLNWTGLATHMPATMRFDYIRIYQDSTGEMSCDPEGYPTTDWIEKYPKAYENANHTTWSGAGYTWPENSFTSSCKASNYTAS